MNDESGPKAAPEDVPTSVPPSVNATTDFFALLAECSGPDDRTFRAASLLADAWGPALARADRLGFERGYTAGFYDAEREMADAWARAAKPIRDVQARPTYS